MIIYKRNFDENRCIYFFIKKEKVFIKYMEILEKVSIIIKIKFNSEAERKKPKHIRRLSMFISTSNID